MKLACAIEVRSIGKGPEYLLSAEALIKFRENERARA